MNSRIRCLVAQCSGLVVKKCNEQILSGSNLFRTIRKDYRYFCTQKAEEISKLIEVDCSAESEEFDMEEDRQIDVDIETITEGDPEKAKKLKVLQLELYMMKQQGEKVPSQIATHHWRQLLSISESNHQKSHYLSYLWLIEVKKNHRKEKQVEANKVWNERKEEMKKQAPITFTTNTPMIYGLKYMTLFYRIYEKQINQFYNYKLLQAEWYGPDILIDCGFEPYMRQHDLSNCVKQLMLAWAFNRDHVNPYNIIFCNVDSKGILLEKLQRVIPTIGEPDFPFNFTAKHYLDLYPKNKLVYLTPHCNEVLHEYNPEDIYIIGGLVDRSRCEPLSLAKAKKEGIRKAKFPLDTYLHWAIGTKSLTINQCLAIMNEKKVGKSWSEAFKHIPARKIHGPKYNNEFEIEEEENHVSAKTIREQYRKNLVYDLLLESRTQKHKKV